MSQTFTGPESLTIAGACSWCSSYGQSVLHVGVCPKVAAIEYHPSGQIKEIRFHPDEKPKPWSIVP